MAKQLKPIDLVAPGSLGLNLTQEGGLLDPRYATKAENAVIDSAGRLGARKGVVTQTTTAITATPDIKSIHRFLKSNETVETIVSWDGGIANDLSDPEGNDISGVLVDADGFWDFYNFNNKCIAVQDGQALAVYTGTGSFTTVVAASGVAPTGAVAAAIYGRIWQLDSDGQTIKYSGLLDETDWGGVGAGSIDMSAVWTQGTDNVRAITGFNGALVVFGENHIVFWNDGTGSVLGLDPDNIVVTDVIEGTGCLSDRTLQPVGETDLLFAAPSGIQSLRRLIEEKSRPIATLSKYVRDSLIANVNSQIGVNRKSISSAYSPVEGFYVIAMPDQGVSWAIDQRRRYTDADGDEVGIVTRWDLGPPALGVNSDHEILMGLPGEVGKYSGSADDGTSYVYSYQSPWMDLGQDIAARIKILKQLGAIIFTAQSVDVTFSWSVDFSEETRSTSKSITVTDGFEWGEGEWGEAEWGGSPALRILRVAARAKGQYYRIGLTMTVTGELAPQQAKLFAKIGRIA